MAKCIRCGKDSAKEYLFAEVKRAQVTSDNGIPVAAEMLSDVFTAPVCMRCAWKKKIQYLLIALLAVALMAFAGFILINYLLSKKDGTNSTDVTPVVFTIAAVVLLVSIVGILLTKPEALMGEIVHKARGAANDTIIVTLSASAYPKKLSDNACKKKMSLLTDLAPALRDTFLLSEPNEAAIEALRGKIFYAAGR